ncbi:MAG: acyl-CoA mutase large subunit family protein [Gammaproteobacteria bacterium]|jgi:methylmalonyl-CoA mutase N-terminal domain/subunit|nr:acyl-CoA mutase large subunit family protein [Gammaproteobacteria bacterium]
MTGKKPEPRVDPALRGTAAWQREYDQQTSAGETRRNRSGIEIKPLYEPPAPPASEDDEQLGLPGQFPMTRGVYASMYRGQPWSQRQIVGVGLPADYNAREHALIDGGSTGAYLAPCNSYMRGYDIDQVPPQLVGMSGTPVNTVDDIEECLTRLPIDRISFALGDNPPFTLSAMFLQLADRQGIDRRKLTGTTTQSDYLSLCVANHMFFRMSLAGSRRLLCDHIRYMNTHVPRWNPVSIIGQHMQQAGATPAQAMGFTLCSAIQYADDMMARGMEPDVFLPRFSFFFDISISFFEEIAKFRAGRRLWARIARDRLGAKDPRSWRMRFHAQTSGADLQHRQPLNNLTRVAVQAMSGILGGCQSLHTDSYDEALHSPSAHSATLALNTQNILKEEAELDQVIDPLGGSYYIEQLTDEMEAAITSVIEDIDAAGGMYQAVSDGRVQAAIGESALRFQNELEAGEHKVVGLNVFREDDDPSMDSVPPLERPPGGAIEARVERFREWKSARDRGAVRNATDRLRRAAHDDDLNLYEKVIDAVGANLTHGEIVAVLQEEMGAGAPVLVP